MSNNWFFHWNNSLIRRYIASTKIHRTNRLLHNWYKICFYPVSECLKYLQHTQSSGIKRKDEYSCLKCNPVEYGFSHVYGCSVFICKVDLTVLGIYFSWMPPLTPLFCWLPWSFTILPHLQSVRRLWMFLAPVGLPYPRRMLLYWCLSFFSSIFSDVLFW